jgi:hypothetical protein
MGYLLSYGDIGKFLRDTITASQIKFPESSQETEKEKIAALQNVILNRETPQERKQSAKFEKYYKKYLKEVTKSLNKELSDKAAAPAEAVAGTK